MSTVEADPAPSSESSAAAQGEWTETTRLMCAAAYLDGAFAQHVFEEVVEQDHRAVHVPPGVDIVAVVRHCLAARHQKVLRDALLAFDLLGTVVAVLAGGSLRWVILGFLVAWAVVLWDMWSSTYGVVVKRLSPLSFDPSQAPAPSDSAAAARIEQLAAAQEGNLTVYSGFLPFAGAGGDLGGWSFVVDLGRSGEHSGAQPRELDVETLYEGTREALAKLGRPDLKITDRLFVSGMDIRDDRALLPDPAGLPLCQVDDSLLRELVQRPTHRVRHYQCIEILDWHGEFVVSMFLRFLIGSQRLFCELSRFLLAPLKADLRRAERLSREKELSDVLALTGRALRATLGLWLRSPTVMTGPLRRGRRRASIAKRVQRDPFFDYGAPPTALDRVRSHRYSHYFQLLDKEMHVKILERTVLDTIVQVLEHHGVDTAELVERRSTIINHGIMVPGGTINAENIAVGSRARIVNRVRGASSASLSPAPASAGRQ